MKQYKITKDYDYTKLCELHRNGYELLCYQCESKLLVALNLEEASKLRIGPGIYCPEDGRHVYIHLYLKEVRERMRDVLQGKKKDKE